MVLRSFRQFRAESVTMRADEIGPILNQLPTKHQHNMHIYLFINSNIRPTYCKLEPLHNGTDGRFLFVPKGFVRSSGPTRALTECVSVGHFVVCLFVERFATAALYGETAASIRLAETTGEMNGIE